MNDKLCEVIEVTNKNTNVLKTLAYKSIDLEARSRRNNLLFWGLLENPNENCFHIIRDFISRHLDLDAGNMYLARAHRLGPRRIGHLNPKRPIIVNFRDFCDTELIMSRANLLRHTPFSVGYDLPKEINEARKKLWAELKCIRNTKPRVKFQILYPAKLIVEGKLVRDEFPDWGNVLHRSRTADFTHIDRNFSFDQPHNHLNTDDLSAREQYLCTKTVNGNSTRSRVNLHMQQEYDDDTASLDQEMEHDSSVTFVKTPLERPLITELNDDLPGPSDSSVIIHEAEVHTVNNEHDQHSEPSTQALFRPYEIDNTITNEQNTDASTNKTHVSGERHSRSLTRADRRQAKSLSVSCSRRASRDSHKDKTGQSKSSQTRQKLSDSKSRSTSKAKRNEGESGGGTAGAPGENKTDGHTRK